MKGLDFEDHSIDINYYSLKTNMVTIPMAQR